MEKFDEKPLPTSRVIVEVDEYPNMTTNCIENKVYITTSLINEIFANAFNNNFTKEGFLSFSKYKKQLPDSSVNDKISEFYKLLYKSRIKPIKFFDDDWGDWDEGDSMDQIDILQRSVTSTDSELTKVIAFLVSHEFYHLITKCKVCSESDKMVEINADAYGLLQYSRLTPPNGIFEALFEEYAGRQLPDILLDIYSKYPVSDYCYLPIEIRVQEIRSRLAQIGDR
jgi:hypothetical protein